MFNRIVHYKPKEVEPQANYRGLSSGPYLYSSHYLTILFKNAKKRNNIMNVEQVREHLNRYRKLIHDVPSYMELMEEIELWLERKQKM